MLTNNKTNIIVNEHNTLKKSNWQDTDQLVN